MSFEHIFRLDGQVALVAGGNGGIGQTLCEALAEFGADVAVSGRTEHTCRAVADRVQRTGRRGIALSGDLTRPEEVERVVGQTIEQLGRVDVVVNCVGGNARFPAQDYPLDEWRRILDLNLTTTLLVSQAAARAMIPRKSGRIINISSVRSQLGIHAGYAAYCAAKGAVNLLTKQLATEWAQYGITVNAIAPTFIRTDRVADMLNDPKFYDSLVRRIPLGRVGETSDLVGATILLASPAASFITGHVLFVDGGVTACQ